MTSTPLAVYVHEICKAIVLIQKTTPPSLLCSNWNVEMSVGRDYNPMAIGWLKMSGFFKAKVELSYRNDILKYSYISNTILMQTLIYKYCSKTR